MRLILGGHVWNTKKSAQDFCRTVLHAYPLGATVTDSQNHRFLLDVLERHGNAEGKIGCGVASFQIEPDKFGHRCFWLTRTDGTRTYFSYLWCFKTSPDNTQRARFAFRSEIQDQIIAFKTSAFAGRETVASAISGQLLTWKEANVDHTPPLHVLRDVFLDRARTRLEDISVQPWREGEHRYLFVNRDFAQAWASFHSTYATLRIVSVEENVEKGGRDE